MFGKKKENDLKIELVEALINTFHHEGEERREIDGIQDAIVTFISTTIKDIMKNAPTTGIQFPIIRSAFRYFYVKVVDAVLIFMNEQVVELNGNWTYQYKNIIQERYGVSEYFGKYGLDPNSFTLIGEEYFYTFQDFITKNATRVQKEGLLHDLFVTALIFIYPYAVYSAVSNIEDDDDDSEEEQSATRSHLAMINEAKRQGWLTEAELKFIPELVPIYNGSNGSDKYFIKFVSEQERRYRETYVHHICRYLFAKAVEGVILWGASPNGKISVLFHPKHLLGEMETEVPKHLRKTVIDTMAIGESLFNAHSEFVRAHQSGPDRCNVEAEIADAITTIPKLGIHYALQKNMQVLR